MKILCIFFFYTGTQFRDFTDCRQHGCTSGECVREGSQYICKQGMFLPFFILFTKLFERFICIGYNDDVYHLLLFAISTKNLINSFSFPPCDREN